MGNFIIKYILQVFRKRPAAPEAGEEEGSQQAKRLKLVSDSAGGNGDEFQDVQTPATPEIQGGSISSDMIKESGDFPSPSSTENLNECHDTQEFSVCKNPNESRDAQSRNPNGSHDEEEAFVSISPNMSYDAQELSLSKSPNGSSNVKDTLVFESPNGDNDAQKSSVSKSASGSHDAQESSISKNLILSNDEQAPSISKSPSGFDYAQELSVSKSQDNGSRGEHKIFASRGLNGIHDAQVPSTSKCTYVPHLVQDRYSSHSRNGSQDVQLPSTSRNVYGSHYVTVNLTSSCDVGGQITPPLQQLQDDYYGHQRIIDNNRTYLVKNVDVLNTPMLDAMVEDEIISQQRRSSLTEGKTTNLQQVSAVLDYLYNKPKEYWDRFLQCLSAYDHQHVVTHLRTGNKTRIAARNHIQDLLAETLNRQCKVIDIWSWDDVRVAVPMNKLYVDLVWVHTKQGIGGKQHQRLRSYAEVFRQVPNGKLGQLIYLSGEAGVGKSTITRKICYDWSSMIMDKEVARLDADHKTGKTGLSSFKYLIPICLRDVKKGQRITEVIGEHLLLEQEDAEELCRLVNQEKASALFLLDGYDEYREGISDEITQLAHRKLYKYANVFITSRNSSASQFADNTVTPDIEVSLQGFTPDGVKEYVTKSFQDICQEEKECYEDNVDSENNTNKVNVNECGQSSGDKAAHIHDINQAGIDLLKEIDRSEDLTDLSRYPALLLLMCHLWRETRSLANTCTGFYQDFIKYMLCRYEKKHKHPEERSEPSEIHKTYHQCLMQISQVATGGMMGEKLELTFPYRKTIQRISKTAFDLGFLIEGSRKHHRFVSFVHKTVQEFFVAYNIVHSDENRQRKLLMHFCSSAKVFRESSMIVTFVSGLGGETLKRQLETVVTGDEDTMARMHTSLQLSYLSENKNAKVELPAVAWLDITAKYPGRVYVRYLSMKASQLVKLVVRSDDETHLRLLQLLKAPELERLWLRGSAPDSPCVLNNPTKRYLKQGLDKTLRKFKLKTLQVWEFHILHDGDTSPDLLAVLTAVDQIRTLENLEFYRTPLTSGDVSTLTESLSCSNLRTLSLTRCRVTSEVFRLVLNALPFCPTLCHLDVSDNRLDDDMEDLIDDGSMEKLSTLRILNLSHNKLSDGLKEEFKHSLMLNCPDLDLII